MLDKDFTPRLLVMHYTSEDDPWLSKESDDLRGVEGLLFVSQGLS